MHGDETVEACAAAPVRVLKAVVVETPEAVERAIAWPAQVALLVDAPAGERRGGSGQRADWSAAARVAARRPIVLAGGLSAENVATAIERVRPWGIDVSSGVEVSPGIKSHERLRALFTALGHWAVGTGHWALGSGH